MPLSKLPPSCCYILPPSVVASLKIRKRLILKKMLPLPAPFQHFHLRFQSLLSKCFRFHKKLTASTASASTSLIVFDRIGVDSILFDPTVPEIFYFKHDVVPLMLYILLIFICNPNVDSLSVITDAFPTLILNQCRY